MISSLGVMGSLPGKLRLLLVSYTDQLPDPLKDQIKLLIEDLEEARTLLVDLSRAEAPMVNHWRSEVREMSYDMEDYIDKQTTQPGSNKFDVEEFRILVDLTRDACKSYYRYNLGRLRPPNPSFLTGGHSQVEKLNKEATYIVGMDDARRKLTSWLRDDAEQRLKVVSILGPAGVGKTTLAQEVYREIGGEFEYRAFVRASRMTDTRRLLWSIISQIQGHRRPSYHYTVQKLIDCLSEHLQHKRYFIVIDGLWETASWDTVRSALPGDTCRGRVFITTDIEGVALECSDYQPNSIFLVEPLNRDYSAELLNNRASGHNPEFYVQLKENLEDIIRTCCGLPLAIISIANILGSQPDNSLWWCQVKERISSRLRNNFTPEGILSEIVGLSYDCLSHDLKICLLYLAVYPEGYTFLKADLLKQWIAEGFISAVQENAYEVAEYYFDELVCRGLIHPNHINFSNTVMSYTLHSTTFEVIRYMSIEENFCTVIDYSNTIPDLSAKVRRLSLIYNNAKYATKPEGITLYPVRSLVFHGFIDCLPSITEFEVLRVLNLEFWGGQEELDISGISHLFQLRYMRIAADITVKLPSEMKGLKYLETLEIYGRVTSVPSDIVHLPSLQHLSLPGEIKLSDGTSHMRSLRTLYSFDLSRNSEDNVWRLGEMTDLHDLHLTCSKSMPESDLLERNLIALARSTGNLGKLKSLVLAPDTSCFSCSTYSDCSSSMPCPPIFLQRLELLPPICIFSRLPKWLEQLRKLCVLKIVVRELTMDDIDNIAGLPELIILSLFVRQSSAEKITFNRAAFPVLKYFKYRCGILRLAFHAETMPSLRTLKLEFNAHSGYQYNDMLTGIENLLNLHEVAGRIGALPDAEESDRKSAESEFKDAILKHPNPLAVNVQRIDCVDQETSEFSTESADLDEQLSRLARAKITNVVSEVPASSYMEDAIYDAIYDSMLAGIKKMILIKTTMPADMSKTKAVKVAAGVVGFDINMLREEARTRWLRPAEVYYILQNHERFPITPEPPKKPPSGSLFLYNRRVNRYFRRDGHAWLRKRNGKTVREAHERLKVGNVDALSCYYAHGEQNPSFQRRCFWMLEPAYEHIVLVQYREVAEGRYYSAQLSNGPQGSLSSLSHPNAIRVNQCNSSASGISEGSESHQSYSILSSLTEVTSYSVNKEQSRDSGTLLSIPELGQTYLEQNSEVYQEDNCNAANKSGLNVALKKIVEQLNLGDDDDGDYIYSNQAQPLGPANNVELAAENQLKQIRPEGMQNDLGRNIAPSWEDMLHCSSGLPTSSVYQQSDFQNQQSLEYQPPGDLGSSDLRIQLAAAKRFLLGPEDSVNVDSTSSNFVLGNVGNRGTSTLTTLDGRLESSRNPDRKAITPLAFQSSSQGSEITELLFGHDQFEPCSRADTRLTLGQKRLFSIREICPEWAFSYEITKIIITGDFLCDPLNSCWAVMFGDSEVPAEIVQPGVLRCNTPLHGSGKLTLCITSGNREVCSELKDFEFRAKSEASNFTELAPASRSLKSSEELLLLAKFARMLLCENETSEASDDDPQSEHCSKLKMNEKHWDQLLDGLKFGRVNPLATVDWIMEELLKSKLQQWLSAKLQAYSKAACPLSKHHQGIIHLISALGFEWALSSVLSAGVGINFRDSNGWTALHWAAYFGREMMIATLLAAGASATAVTDPTAQDPVGKTAAFLASERGHMGLAGYLSEVSLTSHLASLTIEESEISKGSAVVEAERAVETISWRSAERQGGTEDELSIKDSLAAVRNAAQAAARIQNAFRAFSFRKRQQKASRLRDEYGMTQEDIDELAAAAASRSYHQSHALSGQFYDRAAVSIQKKYKGWKGRKNFLNLRRNAVKIQAHVRGHQVRKKYKTFVSTVSVLEKVILRWRRKGQGLRGFRAEQPAMIDTEEEEDDDDVDFDDDEVTRIFRRQKVDEALKETVSRMLSMMDSPEARMQYRRMLVEFQQLLLNWEDQK